MLDGEEDDLPSAEVAVANVLLAPVEPILARLDAASRSRRAISRAIVLAAPGWAQGDRVEADGWAADRFVRVDVDIRAGTSGCGRHRATRGPEDTSIYPPSVATFTTRFLGCKVSFADEQAIRERLLADGHTESPGSRATSP